MGSRPLPERPVRHLSRLEFGDRRLQLRTGTINKAIRRAGGKTDYWEIYNFLPKDSRICACIHCCQLCDDLLLQAQHLSHETNIPDATDTIQVTKTYISNNLPTFVALAWKKLKALILSIRRI